MFVDIGANLTSHQFERDRDQVIRDAFAVGVTTMIVTGSNVEHSTAAWRLTEAYASSLYATAGIHPHHAKEYDTTSIRSIESLCGEPAVVAVGECGLDYNRNFSTPSDQRRCFEAQLEFAATTRKPVFLHERDSHVDFLKIMDRYVDALPGGVVHCFTGTQAELDAYLERGLLVGITGWICDERRGVALRRLIRHIPLGALMIETDAPYLLPRNLEVKPVSRRNEPKFLVHVAQTVANEFGLSLEDLAQHTSVNARKLFGLSYPVVAKTDSMDLGA